MAEVKEKEKETKTKKTTSSSTKKKTTSVKKKSSTTSTKKKVSASTTTAKRGRKKSEEVIPYNDKLSTVVEIPMPYNDKISTVIEEPIPYDDSLSTVIEEKTEKIVSIVQDVAETISSPVKDIINGDFKKKPSSIIYFLVLVLILFMVVVGIYSYFHQEIPFDNEEFTRIGEYGDKVLFDDYYQIYSMEELQSLFPDRTFREIDFEEKDYVILGIEYISCDGNNLKPVSYHFDGDDIVVRIEYEATCDICSPKYVYYLLEIDKDVYFSDVKFDYRAQNELFCDIDIAY